MGLWVKNKSMLILLGLGGLIVLLYGSLCLGLWKWQTRLLFFPDEQLKAQPEAVGLVHKDIWLPVGKAPHNGIVHGWWIPGSLKTSNASIPVILYLHGNGSNIGDLTETAQQFHTLGWHCLLIDYRGYGLSQGSFPTEDTVYEDAEAAWTYLVKDMGFKPQQIVVYGHSLGGAIAIELATRQPQMAGLIVEGSFTSMLEMAKRKGRYNLFPVNWILTQRFESLEKVRSLVPPLLLLHGTADDTVPYSMSQSLHQAAQSSPQHPASNLVLIPEAGHNNLSTVGGDYYTETLTDFITRIRQSSDPNPSTALPSSP